jgi:RHS repeat-associated protein
LMSGASTVATYAYDGRARRTAKTTTYTRHFYYSDIWQCLEERVGSSNCVERQFIWGLRYIDDLIVRDLDTTGGSSSSSCAGTNQRFYVLHDFFHISAIVDTSGVVQERYGYDAFGQSRVMDGSFTSRANSLYGWETRYGAYRWDAESGLYQVRFRYLHPRLGVWAGRDLFSYMEGPNLYAYASNTPINAVDPNGLCSISCCQGICNDAYAICNIGAAVGCTVACTAGCATACIGAGLFYAPCVALCLSATFAGCFGPCLAAAMAACTLAWSICYAACYLCKDP